MRLFNTLSIEIASMCNRKCDWCPVATNTTRPDERMNPNLLGKILRDLAGLEYKGRIELYIYNEPTRDIPYLLEVIRAVREYAPKACIMVATNGDYLKRGVRDIMPMYEAGLNQLLINCYAKGLHQKRLPWLATLAEQGVEVGGPLYPYIGPRRRTVGLMDKHSPEVFGSGVFRLTNRAGNVPGLGVPVEPVARMCTRPFRNLNINWKGDALVCCQDYHGDVEVGNVATHTLTELWNSPVLNTYRINLADKDRNLPLCRTCDCHAGAYPHMIDIPDAERDPWENYDVIVKRFENRIKART